MKTFCIWEAEIEFLAQQWQPLFAAEVMHYYAKRKAALRSAKAAFTDVYEYYFMNQSSEDAHQ